jgi:SOS response regulatory protein OraA/RecX
MKSSVARILVAGFIVIVLMSTGIAVDAVDVSRHHGNLRAAQRLIEKAIDKVTAAQVANEYDMEGHAARAKELLDRAYDEIKLSAMAANRR